MVTRVAVIGTGYVGLSTGVCLAHIGHDVVCVDLDQDKIARLRRGEVPIVEHRLDELLHSGIESGRLTFSCDAVESVVGRDVVFLCVQTPQSEDGSADVSYVRAAAQRIAPALSPGAVVVNKSTVPVGTTRSLQAVLGRDDVRVASNPEFLREGSAIDDCLSPDRVVVGSDDRAAAELVASLYEPLGARTLLTDPETSETIKYAANAFLATKLSFINSIAAVCEAVGADVHDVALGMGYDRRIGSDFLKPGPGWGGSCFPKDSRALVHIAETAGYEFELLRSVIEANEQQYQRIADKIRDAAGGSLQGVRVGVWGLTFKAGTDDLRDSPSIAIVQRLLAQGAVIHAYDPTVSNHSVFVPSEVRLFPSPVHAAAGAQVLTVLTEWPEFASVSATETADTMAQATVVDGRNLLPRDAWRAAGFTYVGVGR